jgi:radical SAM/Cys-rich protein
VGFKEKAHNFLKGPLRAGRIDVLQVNLGYRCNMACKHCHVEGGALKSEEMSAEDAGHVLSALKDSRIKALDLTGGAPELHPSFKQMIKEARALKKHVIVRTNLTVLFEPGMEQLPEFFAANNVEVVASLPYYTKDRVDRVRGTGTFDKSMKALRKLNSLGYGVGQRLALNLVYNPQGAFLAPGQLELEAEYRRELLSRQEVQFTGLFTFTNMPIGRFKKFLIKSGQLEGYNKRLSDAFNPCALDGVMCRSLISVGPDGALYDCDFNLAEGIGVADGLPQHISEFDLEALGARGIMVGEHCHGCVAGQGST